MPSRRTLIRGAAAGLDCAVAAAGVRGLPASAREGVFRTASPTVTGPICGGRHGWPFGAFYGDIGALGYVEEEYFIAGQALRFAPVAALGQDGRWSVEPTTPEDTPRRRHETSSQFAETRIGQKVYNQGKNERAVTS